MRKRLKSSWEWLNIRYGQVVPSALLVAVGTLQVLTTSFSYVVTQAFPAWVAALWTVYLIVGGLLIVMGSWGDQPTHTARKRRLGQLREALGLRLMASAALFYVVCIVLTTLKLDGASVLQTGLSTVLWLSLAITSVFRSRYLARRR